MGFAASLSTFAFSDGPSGSSRTESAYKNSVESSAQPSILHLFFRDSLVPDSGCHQPFASLGFLPLLLAPLPTSRHASRLPELPPRQGLPGLTRCTLTLSLRLDALIRIPFHRPIASCYQLWGSRFFLLSVRLAHCCQLTNYGPNRIPNSRGLTPFEVFPSPTAAIRLRMT